MLTVGVAPAVTAMGAVPLTDVTGAVPEEAAVRRPCASTVNEVFVYEPAVTAVFARAMVPVLVMGPPVKPVPVATFVTVPLVGGAPEAAAVMRPWASTVIFARV
jgi:hypothetical protein